MPTLLAQIAPQRSTQYSALATALAPHEMLLSPLGAHIQSHHVVTLGGQAYVQCILDVWPSETDWRALAWPAMTSAFFEARVTDEATWLRPINLPFTPVLPLDLMVTRRYKGKTNEVFTHFMLNIARHSSAFAHTAWSELRVLDPLSGGGTTLLAALVLGASASGIEQSKDDVESTATFVAQYAREQAIAVDEREERLKKYGRRWQFHFRDTRQQLVLARGDTADCAELLSGIKRPQLIVTDLPYGIQHRGPLSDLLTQALPVWMKLLLPGGALAMSWDSTRFQRKEMTTLVASCGFSAMNNAPYDQLAHRVDRVIKQRDVVVVKA
jgi:hypothetical protein